MQVTIAKALNLKNRLVGEKKRLFNLFSINNSHRETDKVNYDAKALLEQYEATVDKLIATKTAIAKANTVIYDKIYRISELKSKLAELRMVNTNDKDEEQEKTVRIAGGNYESVTTVIKHVAFINEVTMDEKVKGIEKEIETLFDAVTAFNYTTMVEVPE
jgi:hypothetical protein